MLALSILYAGKQQYVSVIVVGEARMVKREGLRTARFTNFSDQ